MSNTARLVYAILEFLENEIQTESVSQEAAESLDVAKQCLQVAYGVSLDNSHLSTGRPLMDMFCEGSGLSQTSTGTTIGLTLDTSPSEEDAGVGVEPAATPITEEDKRMAEEIKNEGNDLMKHSRFTEAAEAYSRAIALDNTNAIYFSNRAAAYNKVNKYQQAIDDCEVAIGLDPNYGKAYGRLGLAYTGLNQLTPAREAYEKACQLDPSNESYRTNLEIAEQKLKDTNLDNGTGSVPGPGLGNLGPSMGGLDLQSILSNPALMNMASTVLQNPDMQQMMQSMMGQAMQGEQTPGGQEGPTGPAAMGNLLQMGQQLASQIQTQNPELVEQVRQMSQNRPNPDPQDPTATDNNNQPPPPPPNDGDNS